MEEIKKLFKNAEILACTCSHKIQEYCDEDNYCREVDEIIPECCGIENCTKKYKDIVFDRYLTDRMQLQLLKVLIEGRWVEFAHYGKNSLKSGYYYAGKIDFKARFEAETFDETLAGLINKLWKNLSEKDQNKIKKILEGRA